MEEAEKFLIVETNFRVYAYDASDLKVSLLALFVDLVGDIRTFVLRLLGRLYYTNSGVCRYTGFHI